MSAERYGGKSAFHAVIGRALVDADFRAQLRDHEQRESALAQMDVDLTPEMLTELDHSMDALERLARSFGVEQAAT